jgi:hypothetical protein
LVGDAIVGDSFGWRLACAAFSLVAWPLWFARGWDGDCCWPAAWWFCGARARWLRAAWRRASARSWRAWRRGGCVGLWSAPLPPAPWRFVRARRVRVCVGSWPAPLPPA